MLTLILWCISHETIDFLFVWLGMCNKRISTEKFPFNNCVFSDAQSMVISAYGGTFFGENVRIFHEKKALFKIFKDF